MSAKSRMQLRNEQMATALAYTQQPGTRELIRYTDQELDNYIAMAA